MNTCENCAYSYRDFTSGAFVCRRYPPTVLMAPNGAGVATQPPVGPATWCGEWKEDENMKVIE